MQDDDFIDCSTSSAVTARNYFYDGFQIFLPTEKFKPFMTWLQKNYFDIRHDGVKDEKGYYMKRDLSKLPNPMKDKRHVIIRQ